MSNANKEHAPLCIMLTCRDVPKSIAFYRGVLGFEMEASWPDDENPMWCNMLMGDQSVMLGASMSPEQGGADCGGDAEAAAFMKTCFEEFAKNKAGVGVYTYVKVADVDSYHAKVTKAGLKGAPQPKTQFYGIRDFPVQDPDGYRLFFYQTVALCSCQSCGMPLTEAKPGQMYCPYCVDASGKLKTYETILEGTTSGYFMQMQKMPREKAVVAAKEHLAKMPAWAGRK
jgi:catechol 2,3-dioxygenase-like lactoylglutathione lyase family enzyme